jgi:hypothetical protein
MKKTTKLKRSKRVEMTLTKVGSTGFVNVFIGNKCYAITVNIEEQETFSKEVGIEVVDWMANTSAQQKLEL